MTTHEPLPYLTSSGLAFSAFEKLQGSKNYVAWKNRMRTVLIALCQWGVVTGAVVAPTPADPDNLTPDEVKAQAAWEVCEISAFMCDKIIVQIRRSHFRCEVPTLIYSQ